MQARPGRHVPTGGGGLLATNAGNYQIQYTRILESNENGSLTNDGVVSGDITVGDIDTYVFDVNAGEAAHIRVIDTNGDAFYPQLWLYNPDGTLNQRVSAQMTAEFDCYASASYCRLNQAGTYRLVVEDLSATNAGNYQIQYTRILESNENGSLTNDGVVSGDITVGDIDTYVFDVNAGEAAHIRVIDTNGDAFYPQLWLYNPDGTLNQRVSAQMTAEFDCYASASYCRLNQAGTYRLVVEDLSATNAGNYQIQYTRILESNENGSLTNDGVVSGDITVGDIDTYVFDVNAGEAAHIRVIDTNGDAFYPQLWLYNPDGTLNQRVSDQTTAEFDCYASASYCRLNQAGTYRLVVEDLSATNAGNYEITFDGPPQVSDRSLDRDKDAVFDIADNCPNVPNISQQDSNSNGIGDACDFGASTISPTPVTVINAAGLYVREGPGTSYPVVSEISNGQTFVAFQQLTQSGNTWYRIYQPCGNTGWCAAWIAGANGGTTYVSQSPSATQVQVGDTENLGLNLRASPGGSVRDSVYDNQYFVTTGSAPSGNGCNSNWYAIDTPLSSLTPTGWVCGDYVGLAGAGAPGPANIAGKVSGPSGFSASNVTMSLSGAATASTSPAGSGDFSFTNLPQGSYTITPGLAGYTFQPASHTRTLTGVDTGGLDFRACETGTAYTGTLTDATGNPITNAEVTIGGVTVTPNASGDYSVPGLACGSHPITVTPTGGATFMPFTGSVDTFSAWNFNVPLADESTTYGIDSQSGKGGDPVDTATGNYIYQHRDLELAGVGMPFTFDRSYNSRDDRSGPLGFNWAHNWDASLDDAAGIVRVRWGDGGTQTWSPDGAGGFTPQVGVFDALIDDGGGAYTVRKRDLSEYHFDTSGRLASVRDRNNNTITLTYTGGKLSQITDTAGRTLSLSYDVGNRLTQITDPIGRTIQFAYDVNGDLVTATDANGNATTYSYDGNHQILSIVDPRGNTLVSNTYDAQDRVVTYQTDAKGGATTYVYAAGEFETTFTDALGHATVHTHDSLLRLIREEDGNGGIMRYDYDSAGNRSQVTDKNGNATVYGYDARGNVTSKTDALGNTVTLTYDGQNNPLSRTDALGNITQFQYDAKGNLVQTTDALGNTATVNYTAAGQPLTLTDALGRETTHAYDAEGNRIQTTDALGNITAHTYDGAGRRLTSTDPLGRITSYSYDANDNLLSVTDPLGHTVTHTYDGNDNRLSTRDRNGNLTNYSYDQKDLLTTTTDALGHTCDQHLRCPRPQDRGDRCPGQYHAIHLRCRRQPDADDRC